MSAPFRWLVAVPTAALAAAAVAAPRDIQFVRVDFVASTIELRNTGAASESLANYRFCSHDENQLRQYSNGSALNAVTLAPGESLILHFGNDAPIGNPRRLNVSAIGPFAGPLDRGPWGLQIYFPPVNFGNGATIADHIQWSIAGAGNASADERSDEAQAGGVWVNQAQWIATTDESLAIELRADQAGLVLHSPASYNVIEPAEPCPADFNADTTPGDIFDLFDFLAALDTGLDFNGDTTPADIFDLFDFLAVLDQGCP